MGVKYSCSKCGKKFVDWGAKKIKAGNGCDDCKGEFLELVGFDAAQAAPKKKPALRRKRAAAKKKTAKKKTKSAASREDSEIEPEVATARLGDDVANLDDGGTNVQDGIDANAGGL